MKKSLSLLLGAALTACAGAAFGAPQAATNAMPATTKAMPAAKPADPAAVVTGLWVTPNDKSRVRIYKAADGKYDGRIVWLKQPDYPADFSDKSLAGKPKVDRHNPDKSLRSRPVLGLDILTGFQYSPSDHDWRKGKCYDPEDGKTYTCRMWLKDDDTLMVRGYVWIFHKTQTWHRYVPPPASAGAPGTAR